MPAALMRALLVTGDKLRVMVLTARTIDVIAGDYRVYVSHNTSRHVDVVKE